jgi:hypothetical protein
MKIDSTSHRQKRLDLLGKHCKCKPHKYRDKRLAYCSKCKRMFSLKDGLQVESWAWRRIDDNLPYFEKRK